MYLKMILFFYFLKQGNATIFKLRDTSIKNKARKNLTNLN